MRDARRLVSMTAQRNRNMGESRNANRILLKFNLEGVWAGK